MTKYAVVRTISTFYHEFAVPLDELQKLNADADASSEWLADMVVMGEVEEIGQQYLGEQVISHDVVPEDIALKMLDAISPYLSGWTEQQKIDYMSKTIETK